MIWFESSKPIIGLAPMADFIDQPFCRLLRDYDKDTLIFREMISAEALVRNNRKTLEMCAFEKHERPLVFQIFGSNPESMAKAAEYLERNYEPDGIDINMGCPVPKAIGQGCGADLMRNPQLAQSIIKAVRSAIMIPLSVKTRLGWASKKEMLDFAPMLEQAGVQALEIHGRTQKQGYSGTADWEAVGAVVKKLSIPVLVNGDIIDPQSAKLALEQSGAAGILVGRGVLGKPWLLHRIKQTLSTGQDPCEPNFKQRMEAMKTHARYQIERYGEHGIIKMRKLLPWYLKDFPNLKSFKQQAVHVANYSDLEKLVEDVLIS